MRSSLFRHGRALTRMSASVNRKQAELLGASATAKMASSTPQIIAAELVALDYNDLVAGKDLTEDIERGKETPHFQLWFREPPGVQASQPTPGSPTQTLLEV